MGPASTTCSDDASDRKLPVFAELSTAATSSNNKLLHKNMAARKRVEVYALKEVIVVMISVVS